MKIEINTSRLLAVLAGSLVLFALPACKKKEVAPPAPTTQTAPAPSVVETPPPRDMLAERVAKLGFLRHLPQDTEVVFSFLNGADLEKRFRASKTGGLLLETARASSAENLETPKEVTELLGREVTLAFGKGTAAQTGKLLTVNRRYNHHVFRHLARSLTGIQPEASPGPDESFVPKSGDTMPVMMVDPGFALGQGDVRAMAKELANDPALEGLAASLEMPPVLLAFGVDATTRWSVDKTVKDAIGEMKREAEEELRQELVEEVSFTEAGIEFKGLRLPGAKLGPLIGAAERKEISDFLGEAKAAEILAALEAKNLVVASGSTESHVVVFVGSSPEALVLADTPENSLLASAKLGFFDESASKDLVGLAHVDKVVSGSLMKDAGGMADVAGGFIEGLRESDGLGDTVKLQELLAKAIAAENALRDFGSNSDFGAVAFLEDGLRVESYGGYESGAYDWNTPNRMASLGDDESVAFFANCRGNKESNAAAMAYIESLVAALYEAGMTLTDTADLAKIREGLLTFDQGFREDALGLWSALVQAGEGLGEEHAMVIDLKGKLPPLPGLPAQIIENGNIPRISLLSPVTDRSKLASAWKTAQASIEGILEEVGKISGSEIPPFTPMSSNDNGSTVWFYALPFFNDDFLPSLTVSDDLFSVSTSKSQTLDLFKAVREAEPGRPGLYVAFRSKPMKEFIDKTLGLIEANQQELPADPASLGEAKKVFAALEEFEGFTVHARELDGTLRISTHIKVKKD